MAEKDPYKILGVSRSATVDEIKRAYRRLAKENHPDRNPGNDAAEKRFKEIQAAYEVLGDPQRRAQFDQFGAGGPIPDFQGWNVDASQARNPFAGGSFDVGGIDDLSSIFAQFFSRGAGPRTQARGRPHRAPHTRPAPRGADVEVAVELSLRDAILGTKRSVRVQSPGNGTTQNLEVSIPAGVRDGQRIRLREQGQPGPGGRGDLFIRCRLKPDPFFRAEGDDLHLELPVSLLEAVEGAQIDIPTPRGMRTLTIPPGTSSGTRLRMRGEGLPNPRTKTPGHLYVRPRITLPKELDDEARAVLQSLPDAFREKPRSGAPWEG